MRGGDGGAVDADDAVAIETVCVVGVRYNGAQVVKNRWQWIFAK